MAITLIHVEWLMAAKRDGVAFGRVLTLGRQHWLVDRGALTKCCARFGLSLPANEAGLCRGGWADAFFRECLGTRELVALDNSEFEEATWLHDLNEAVAADRDSSFDVVLDLGTLEHVFNFPEGLRNCLRMVKPKGVFMWSLPANNQCGHGFYQFSPELIFRAFDSENGYKILNAVLVEPNCPNPEFSTNFALYSARDPDEVGMRSAFVSTNIAGMLVTAQRERVAQIFRRWPQQSDYAKRWDGRTVRKQQGHYRRLAGWIMSRLSPAIRCLTITWYQRFFGMKISRTQNYHRIHRL